MIKTLTETQEQVLISMPDDQPTFPGPFVQECIELEELGYIRKVGRKRAILGDDGKIVVKQPYKRTKDGKDLAERIRKESKCEILTHSPDCTCGGKERNE